MSAHDWAWAYDKADEIIADVQRGSPAARELVAARLLLGRAEGECAGMAEARSTVDRILPAPRKLS